MRFFQVQSGESAVVIDVSVAYHGWSETVRRAVFEAMKLREEDAELVFVADHMVPASDGLVVPVAAFVIGIEEIIRQAADALAGGVGAGHEAENLLRHRAHSIGRNHVVRKW